MGAGGSNLTAENLGGASSGQSDSESPTAGKKLLSPKDGRPSVSNKISQRAKSVVGSVAQAFGAPKEKAGNSVSTIVESQIDAVKHGFLKKKGVVNIAWKSRFFVLSEHSLGYFEDETADVGSPKGFISLDQITKVEHAGTGFKFNVVTPTRIYRLQAEDSKEMEAWIGAISGTAAKTQQKTMRKRNVSHYAIRGLQEEEAGLHADLTSVGPHQPSSLRQYLTWNEFEVAAWLHTFGQGQYSQTFYQQKVAGKDLQTLTVDKCAKLGVEKADRAKIVAAAKKLLSDANKSL